MKEITKVYAFFLYVPEEDMNHYPLAKRYKQSDPEILYGSTRRILYAFTDRKSYRDQFIQERNMEMFGDHPTTIRFQNEEEYEKFQRSFMGRELEQLGIENYRFTARSMVGRVLGTSDEFSFVQYDFPDLICPTAETEIPISNIFSEEFKKSLTSLKYPFEGYLDFFDGYGWNAFDNGFLILDEYGVFVKYFSNLYRDPKKGAI